MTKHEPSPLTNLFVVCFCYFFIIKLGTLMNRKIYH